MGKLWWLPFGRVPEVSAQTLHALLQNVKSPPQLLDVRTPGEWTSGRISGSINVPVTELNHRLPGLALDKNRPVVALCRSARRSIPAVRLLQDAGFREVCQLQGGMLAWQAAGLSVEGDQVPPADTCN